MLQRAYQIRPFLVPPLSLRIELGAILPSRRWFNFSVAPKLEMQWSALGEDHGLDLSPILRQMVKTHFSLNGELSHGVVT